MPSNAAVHACLRAAALVLGAAAVRPLHGGGDPSGALAAADFGVAALRAGKPRVRVKIKETEKLPKEETWETGNLTCGDTVKVTSSDNKKHRCPLECPFFAQDKRDEAFCTFRCVKDAVACKAMNDKTVIADVARGICRKPMVQYCSEYNFDGTDTCKVCNKLYRLGPDGQCYSKFKYAVYGLLFVFLAFVALLIAWVTDMFCRPVTNPEVMQAALEFRSHQKLRMSKEDGRHVWPLGTNLLSNAVAGAGMKLHYTFQAHVIIWALFVACAWMATAALVDPALWILGTRKFGTPRDNCILVAWGYEKQHGLMWSKVNFLVIVYTVSFALALVHSIRQLRLFQGHDYRHKTMKDFVAICEGVPAIGGSEPAELLLKGCVAEASGQPVVGVSVAWDFEEHQEEVEQLLLRNLAQLQEKKDSQEEEEGGALSAESADEGPEEQRPEPGPVRRRLLAFETSLFGPGEEEAEDEVAAEAKAVALLEGLHTSSTAFVVFDTEDARDSAVAKCTEVGGFTYGDSCLRIYTQLSEPDTVEWHNFGHTTTIKQLLRLFRGFGAIFVALVFWTVVFYLPYAYSIFSFNFDNGQQPGIAYSITFSMVVVIGNQIMYEVCARVSDAVGFKFSDTKAVCYMMLFTVACLYNVLVDMVTTYFMAERIMEELGFRTYFGKKLSEIDTFTEKFETYAMQRALAENTFAYAFPSTFLIPFIIEPIMTIAVPLTLGLLIVRSHPEIKGREAEGWIAAIPMDMGRYADITLNMLLGILIFYFPGGYTHWLFLGMAGSHIFVYLLDHYRLLRSVPAITIATMDVDWWCQVLLAPCCGLILSCTVFKANCHDYGFCIKGVPLIMACSGAFAAHCAVHLLLLGYVVPLFGVAPPEVDPCAGVTFGMVNEHHPKSWFSMNPVHCLRSKHILRQKPACHFAFSGKEHLLEVNKEIGCYFHDEVAISEDFGSVRRMTLTDAGWATPRSSSTGPKSPKSPDSGMS